MAETRDLGFAVGAAGIANRHLCDLEAERRRPENEVEVTERIEVAEIGASCLQPQVVRPA